MPFRIFRVPRGLNELLSLQGGETPRELEDRLRASIDILQFYGLQQRQVLTQQGVIAEGGSISVVLPSNWCVLFSASLTITKTATMTALRAALVLQRDGLVNILQSTDMELGPFGATETGPASVAFWAPVPILCKPIAAVGAQLQILGTDANATVSCTAEVGVLG